MGPKCSSFFDGSHADPHTRHLGSMWLMLVLRHTLIISPGLVLGRGCWNTPREALSLLLILFWHRCIYHPRHHLQRDAPQVYICQECYIVCREVTRVSTVVSDSNRAINHNQINREYFLAAPDMFSMAHLNLEAESRTLEADDPCDQITCRTSMSRWVAAAISACRFQANPRTTIFRSRTFTPRPRIVNDAMALVGRRP